MQDKVLTFLKKHSDFLSGEELSRKLDISRAGVWKYIEELRKEGYVIEAIPNKGYRLTSSPDKLFPHEIQYELKTHSIGKTIHHFDSLSSTMDKAVELAMNGALEGTVVCAETQTKGRGRQGRTWISPVSKGIYVSIILRPKLSPTDASKLTLLSAVALNEAIKNVCNIKTAIKWPNDILYQNKKIAGILTELNAEMDCVRHVVIGMGINVNTSLADLPPGSMSLKEISGKVISRAQLLKEILRRFEYWYNQMKKEGFVSVIARWDELSSTIGSRIRINDLKGSIEGEAVGLDEYGGLVIRNNEGFLIKRMSGDVVEI